MNVRTTIEQEPLTWRAGGKKLYATIDYADDVRKAGRFYGPEHFDQLMAYLAGIGVSRVDWVTCGIPLAASEACADPMREAAAAAHRHGLRFYACLKEFEGGIIFPLLPHTVPVPPGSPFIEDLRGRYLRVDPFVAAHPELRYRRRPGDWNPCGPVTAIKLVKADTAPTHVRSEHLSIWTGAQNGRLEEFQGRFSFSEGIEWRLGFPEGGERRVLTLSGFTVPESQRYIFVRCDLKEGAADFGNGLMELMEIYGEDGRPMAHTPAERRYEPDHIHLPSPVGMPNLPDRPPEIEAFLADRARVRESCPDFYSYDETKTLPYDGPPCYLDGRGFAGVARGKNEYLPGALDPNHPEVREHWLELVLQCADAGVDGVDFRGIGHSILTNECDEYGFGDAVLAAAGGRVDRDVAHRVNGDAYTEFLRQARKELRARGLCMCIHANATTLYPDDRRRAGRLHPPLPNCEFQWERWLHEDLCDEISLKDMHILTEAHADYFVDKVSRVAREYGKPVIFLSNNKDFERHSDRFWRGSGKNLRFDGSLGRTRHEMLKVLAHPRLDGYNLYETMSFTGMNAEGRVVGSPAVAEFMR